MIKHKFEKMDEKLTKAEADRIVKEVKESSEIGKRYISIIDDKDYEFVSINSQSTFGMAGEYCIIVILSNRTTSAYPLDYFEFKNKFRRLTAEDRLRTLGNQQHREYEN